MAETTPSQETSDPEQDDQARQASVREFWDEFDKRVKGHLDSFYKDKIKDFRSNAKSRTGDGRPTVYSMLANLMFGPEKKDDGKG